MIIKKITKLKNLNTLILKRIKLLLKYCPRFIRMKEINNTNFKKLIFN